MRSEGDRNARREVWRCGGKRLSHYDAHQRLLQHYLQPRSLKTALQWQPVTAPARPAPAGEAVGTAESLQEQILLCVRNGIEWGHISGLHTVQWNGMGAHFGVACHSLKSNPVQSTNTCSADLPLEARPHSFSGVTSIVWLGGLVLLSYLKSCPCT